MKQNLQAGFSTSYAIAVYVSCICDPVISVRVLRLLHNNLVDYSSYVYYCDTVQLVITKLLLQVWELHGLFKSTCRLFEQFQQRFYIFAEEQCKSTIRTSEPCSPTFKGASGTHITHQNPSPLQGHNF